MSDIYITTFTAPSPACQPVEIVERKGPGQPDTVCDALAEELSRTPCRFHLDNFGLILHHNVDQGVVMGWDVTSGFRGRAGNATDGDIPRRTRYSRQPVKSDWV